MCDAVPYKPLSMFMSNMIAPTLLQADHIPSNFLKAVFHKFYLLQSLMKLACETASHQPVTWAIKIAIGVFALLIHFSVVTTKILGNDNDKSAVW